MEARKSWPLPSRSTFLVRTTSAVAVLIVLSFLPKVVLAQRFIRAAAPGQMGQEKYKAVSTNFSAVAPDPNLAKKVVRQAEVFRKELAIKWLGYELEDWDERCPITVQIAPHAGGETSFAFVAERGRMRSGYRTGGSTPGGFNRPAKPMAWKMKIFGPANRVLDSVLPHEITHTIFATHFGQPLPRWADEGACTTVEHESERGKNHQMLISFLTSKPSRGIPFNRMFTMKQYPHDILPLYAQGYSLCRYLIQQKGHRHFIDFVEAGLENESGLHELRNWDRVVQQFYGHKDLSELQIKWQAWVASGSRAIKDQSRAVVRGSQRRDLVAGSKKGLVGTWYATQTKRAGSLIENNYSTPLQPKSGIEQKEVSRSTGTQAFLPGSTGETVLRKPASRENAPVTTSDLRHRMGGTIWR